MARTFRWTGPGSRCLTEAHKHRELQPGDTFTEPTNFDWSSKKGFELVRPAQAGAASPEAPGEGAAPSPTPPPDPNAIPADVAPDDLRGYNFGAVKVFVRARTGKTPPSWDTAVEGYRSWLTAQGEDEEEEDGGG